MNGSLDFAVAWWWFPLLVAPGVWLTVRLYLRGPVRHPALAVLSVCVWVVLGVWALSPTWRHQPETWHPPLVVLAVDDGASYAALGAREIALTQRRAARTHYESRGFRVDDADFPGHLPGGSAYLNLQAVLLWSDGRAPGLNGRGATGLSGASGPVHPVRVSVETGEVQGEEAAVRLLDEGADGRVLLMVAWRAAGARAADARIQLHVEGKSVWTAILAHPSFVRAGERVTSEVALPAAAAEAVRDARGEIRALVRPAEGRDNVFVENDTVAVDASQLRRAWQVFIRPLTTLHERGLMDALREDSRFRVAAMSARDARERLEGDGAAVVWMPQSRPALSFRPDEGVAVVRYHFPSSVYPARQHRGFSPDARIGRAAQVDAVLPAGALRLADLGFAVANAGGAEWVLAPEREGIEPLAWVEEDGRRGLLFWRDLQSGTHGTYGTYGFVVPPLWDVRFQPDGASGAAAFSTTSLMTAWVRGAAWWTLMHGSGAVGADGEAPARPAASTPSSSSFTSSPSLPSSSLARLGTDVEALALLAARQGTSIVMPGTPRQAGGKQEEDEVVRDGYGTQNGEDARPWPVLPEGHMREARERAYALTPSLPAALVLVGLLACVWFARKRLQLD